MALHGRTEEQPSAPAAVHGRASSASPPPLAVTLDRPRPGAERAGNLYSLAPRAAERPAARGRPAPAQRGQHGHRAGPSRSDSAEKASAGKTRLREQGLEKRPVREQPGPLKKPAAPEPASGGDSGSELEDSIVCARCGRCRCEACRTPRPLPQRLLCGRTCLLSADTCVDFASCMCCVKAAAYHCAASDSGSAAADRPCACSPAGTGCCLRWSALLLLLPLVPCLACYWPLRAAARLAQVCYSRGDGCTCPRPPEPGPPPGPVPRRADRPAVADPPRLCERH